MSEHDDLIYLDYIDTTAAALARTASQGKEHFLSDADARDATIYRLQTLAESTQRLSADLKGRHPEVPWDDIARFRNRVVHGYLGVDAEIVWDIVERHVPDVAQCVKDELNHSADGRHQPSNKIEAPISDWISRRALPRPQSASVGFYCRRKCQLSC